MKKETEEEKEGGREEGRKRGGGWGERERGRETPKTEDKKTVDVLMLFQINVLGSFGYIPRSGIARSKGRSIF